MKNSVKKYIMNLIYPPKCVFCRTLLPISTETPVCSKCMSVLPFCLAYERCKICGKPITSADKCEDCRSMPYRHFDKACAAYIYKDNVKTALIKFKSERYSAYARVFAGHMKAVIENDFKKYSFDAVVSVPPRTDRIKSGEYDQAACLADELAKLLELPYYKKVLAQKEKRRKQSDLTAEERIKNVEGNYIVKQKGKIENKTLLLVDDICTTGATLSECSKVLKISGACAVYCATVATVI